MFTTDFSSKERTPRNSIKCNQISHHKISKRYVFETTKLFIELNSQRKHLTIEVEVIVVLTNISSKAMFLTFKLIVQCNIQKTYAKYLHL